MELDLHEEIQEAFFSEVLPALDLGSTMLISLLRAYAGADRVEVIRSSQALFEEVLPDKVAMAASRRLLEVLRLPDSIRELLQGAVDRHTVLSRALTELFQWLPLPSPPLEKLAGRLDTLIVEVKQAEIER